MSRMKKAKLPNEYVQVPNVTAKAVEVATESQTISLGALGLIVNLWSYDVENWELHKTELYKRFGKHGERSIRGYWNELIEANFIIEFKYRIGKKWEYEYYYRVLPFTKEEKEEYLAESLAMYGKISTLQNADPKKNKEKCEVCAVETSRCRPQKVEVSNIVLTKYKLTKDYKDLNLNRNYENIEKDTEHEQKSEHDINKLPLPNLIKKYIEKKNLFGYGQGTPIYDSLDPLGIVKFYHEFPYVEEIVHPKNDCYISEIQFLDIIRAIVEKGPRPVRSTVGILKDYTTKKLSFKTDNIYEYREIAGDPTKPSE